MKPIEIPTDNLYKFMAIAGMAVVLGCAYMATSLQREIHRASYDQLARERLWDAEIQRAETDAEYLKKSAAALESIERREPKSAERSLQDPATSPTIRSLLERTRDELTDFAERAGVLRRNLVANNVQREELTERMQLATKWFLLLSIGTGLGAFLSFWGFVLWYRRVQVYLDAQIRLSAKASALTPVEQRSVAPPDLGDSHD